MQTLIRHTGKRQHFAHLASLDVDDFAGGQPCAHPHMGERVGSHLGLLTAAYRAHPRLAGAQGARLGSLAPAAGNSTCWRARSAAISGAHRRLRHGPPRSKWGA